MPGPEAVVDAPRSRSEISNQAPAGTGWRSSTIVAALTSVSFWLALITGCGLRAWWLFHRPITSDEAVAGLMAHQFLHGHFSAFFWGQSYAGVEPYVVAAVFAVAGQSGFTLGLTPVLLSALSAILVWRIARRLVADRRLAALAGAIAWAAPLAVVYQSVNEGGSRGVTMACGLGALLFALRILDGSPRYRDFIGLGVVSGIGWWSLPEIVYFAVPVGLIVVGAVVARKLEGLDWWVRRLGVAGVAFFVGALPWIWANVQSGLASLRASAFQGSASPLNHGYGSRLRTFFESGLPLELGLRKIITGAGIWGGSGISTAHHTLQILLFVVVLGGVVAMVLLCAGRGGRALAIAGALVAFPFLVAAQPGTWSWQDGRYLVYLSPLLALAMAVASEEAGARIAGRRARSHSRHDGTSVARVVASGIVLGSLALTVAGFHWTYDIGPTSFARGWGNPEHPSNTSIGELEAKGIRTGYADYWVAYKLDFLSHGTLGFTVAGADPDRWPQLDRQVGRARGTAWLFVPASHLKTALAQFGPDVNGPQGLPERSFATQLDHLGIPYRVVDAGLFDAVIPSTTVDPTEIDFPGRLP
jgi:hypothetical protein